MIKVLHYGIDSKLGGIETYLYKLYNNIDSDEFHFDFLYAGSGEPYYYKEFSERGSEFYRITPRSKNPVKNRRELMQLFKEKKFDVIHCHMNTLSYVTPIFCAVKNNIPVVVHSRNAGASKSKITNMLHKINSLFLPSNKIRMISVSGLAGNWLFGKNSDFTVINNGLDIDKYMYNEHSRLNIRQEFHLYNEELIIHLGAMREQKNHLFLLDIFSEYLKLEPTSKLLLVGDGELKREILEKINYLNIEKNVIVAGLRRDVSNMLSAADLFLFPSFFEGFPNAVLEAQTSGLPCLISNEITNEVIITEDCYSMSLSADSKAWANKLYTMKKNSDFDRKRNAKVIIDHGFSVQEEMKKISDLYRDIVRNKVSSLL